MLSMSDDPEHIDAALRLGAAGYLVKSINPLDLPTAIRGTGHRTVYHPRASTSGDTARPAIHAGSHGLTNRELAVLKLVAEGPSNVDIARMLCVIAQTVKFHLSNIYQEARRQEPHRGDRVRLPSRPGGLTARTRLRWRHRTPSPNTPPQAARAATA